MPLYEFRCEECGTFFEKLVSHIDSPVTCIQCQGKRVKKQFSVFATTASDTGRGAEPPASCNTCPSAGHGMCERE
ncbi:MAG: zinc ribbon domain-containing protein [Nitrospirae bacterium]|nr:zinc ribbon domain-containing protein [Nitrospirota bacterium]